MTATADDVYYDYSSNSSNIPDVPDNEYGLRRIHLMMISVCMYGKIQV